MVRFLSALVKFHLWEFHGPPMKYHELSKLVTGVAGDQGIMHGIDNAGHGPLEENDGRHS